MPPLNLFLITVIPALSFFAVLVWYSYTRSAIKRAERDVAAAEADVTAALSDRLEALEKALDAVRPHVTDGKKLLLPTAVFENGASVDEKSKQALRLDELSGEIFSVAADCPALASDKAFAVAAQDVANAEDAFRNARRLYNDRANRFNSKLVAFPSRLVANRMCLSGKTLFTAHDGIQKQQ